MRDLVLTGFMGTGKTTTGRLLAERCGLAFVDTDAEIERRAGRTVAEIFAADGEARFRELESDVLQELMRGEGRVIATGGGTLLSPQNREVLGPDRPVLCLTCTPEILESRMMSAGDRPLLNGRGGEGLRTLLAERAEVYALFPQVDTSARSPAGVADAIARKVNLHELASFTMDRRQRSSILFQAGGIARLGEFLNERDLSGAALVVTDSHVAELGIADAVTESLRAAGLSAGMACIPAGESHKTLAGVEELYRAAMRMELDRSAIVVGVGGGVVGDVAGLVAATYLRGLRLVLAPTTLVAQVDAAIGGKVGVDLDGAKNLVGAFHPADLILIDPEALRTLPAPAVSDGLAEIVKIAFVRSAALLDELAGVELDTALAHPHVIRRAAEEKVRVVRDDPYESGERMLLNFGHTVGHGLEAASGYALSHGQAVSAGMAAELRLAVDLGWSPPELLPELLTLLDHFNLPLRTPALDVERALDFIGQDKKRRGGQVRVAVPTGRGRGAVYSVTDHDLRDAVAAAVAGSR